MLGLNVPTNASKVANLSNADNVSNVTFNDSSEALSALSNETHDHPYPDYHNFVSTTKKPEPQPQPAPRTPTDWALTVLSAPYRLENDMKFYDVRIPLDLSFTIKVPLQGPKTPTPPLALSLKKRDTDELEQLMNREKSAFDDSNMFYNPIDHDLDEYINKTKKNTNVTTNFGEQRRRQEEKQGFLITLGIVILVACLLFLVGIGIGYVSNRLSVVGCYSKCIAACRSGSCAHDGNKKVVNRNIIHNLFIM